MPEDAGYKRRNYFIKRGFQSRFILKFCLLLLCGIALSTGLIFLLSQGTLTSSFSDSRLVINRTSQAIMPTLLITNLITLGIITLAAIAVTLFVSHRIAGPMFRFEQDIKKIARGDLSVRINLRRKDQFSEMATAFNEMVSGLNEKITKIDREIDTAIESKSKDDGDTACERRLVGLKEIIFKEFKL